MSATRFNHASKDPGLKPLQKIARMTSQNVAQSAADNDIPRPLDRPVFLVGCCKSGTTVLGFVFLNHPELGPKSSTSTQFASVTRGTSALLHDVQFDQVAHAMECKSLWDRYFPMNDLPLRIGQELKLLANPLDPIDTSQFSTALSKELGQEERLFSKHPANSFRVHVLREIFPNAKIIAIHRDGRDVAASWGRKGNRWQQFGGYENALRLFCRKWNETVDHLERFREELEIMTVRYEDLIHSPQSVLRSLFQHCEIDDNPSFLTRVALRSETGLWQSRIPTEHHKLVQELTERNRARLDYDA